MIHIEDNFLSTEECSKFIQLYSSMNREEAKDNIYRYKGVDLLKEKINYSEITPKFETIEFTKLRVQLVNSSIEQITNYHLHESALYTFVIFLNTIEEGNLEFTGGISIKPEQGRAVYFYGTDPHRVQQCSGDRFTLVGFFNSDWNLKKTKKII